MKQAIISPNLSVTVVETPIPSPEPDEVIIKVVTIGINPIDWKGADPEVQVKLHGYLKAKEYANLGKDVAGYVHSVGANVSEFQPGDRVHATNHGSGFAEYSIGPSHTTTRIPDRVSFEEAVTFGLGYITAALNLYRELRLPEPWNPATQRIPLVIYGASSTVGAFAVKLARLSNIHPIYAIAGRGGDFVASLLDKSKGDTVIDYREGPNHIVEELHRLDPRIEYVLDAISTDQTISTVARIPDAAHGRLSLVLPPEAPIQFGDGIKVTVSFAPALWEPNEFEDAMDLSVQSTPLKAFAYVYYRYLSYALANDLIKHHPYEVVPGGLKELPRALKDVRDGKNSGTKYIFRIDE